MALDTYTYFPLMFFFTVRDNQSVRSGDLIGLLYWRAYFYPSNKEFDPQNLNIKDEHGDVLELCHEVRADIAGLIKTDGLPWRGMPPAMGRIHTDYILSIPSDFKWVPEQISVIGFSDGILSKCARPHLTTISQHGFQMGAIAAKTLINRLEKMDEGEQVNYSTQVVKTELILRDSTLNNMKSEKQTS